MAQNNIPKAGSAGVKIDESPWCWLFDFFKELEVKIPARDVGWKHRMMVKYYGNDTAGWRRELTLEVQREDGIIVDLFLSTEDIEENTPTELAMECAKVAREVKAPKTALGKDSVKDDFVKD